MAMSVSPPPGGRSGRRLVSATRWNSFPSFVERWTKEVFVVAPHGPDSRIVPSLGTNVRGSPSVRCRSTTVDDENVAFQLPYVGVGVTVIGLVVEPGGG